MEHLIEEADVVYGRPRFAAVLNLEREALRQALPFPVVIFLTDDSMDRLGNAAPDFF